jgi:integrase
MRDVFDRWKRTDDAIRACARGLEAFEAVAGRPALAEIKRADGVTFRADLLSQPISSKTAHDRLTWVKSLLRFAYRDLEWLDRQPWEGLDLPHKTEAPRRPWHAAEIATFFNSPVHSAYTLPTLVDAAGPAAYWIPLLGLYSGARVGELCQLRVSDITSDSAGPVLSISEAAEGARVKTAAGTRVVPVHSDLVRLGFLDYVLNLNQAGEAALWPAMRFRKGKPGANFSQWFSTARAACPGGVPDFHSLRHTVRTKLAEVGISDRVKDRITGHAVQGSTGTRVYEHATPAELRRAVESIKYPGLKLPKVYRDRE